MVRIRPERYPPGTVKKLHARSAGPLKILKKVNSNAYVVDLSPDFGNSPSFNVEDLIAYKGLNFFPDLLDESCRELISESSYYLLFSKYIPPIWQNKLMKLLMIRLSLLEMMVTTDFCFVGKDYLILITLGLIEKNSNGCLLYTSPSPRDS